MTLAFEKKRKTWKKPKKNRKTGRFLFPSRMLMRRGKKIAKGIFFFLQKKKKYKKKILFISISFPSFLLREENEREKIVHLCIILLIPTKWKNKIVCFAYGARIKIDKS